MSTKAAAEMLLNDGGYFNALDVGRLFGKSSQQGQRFINNLVDDPRYKVEQKFTPEHRIKVVSIAGRKQSIDVLQNTALLFARPKSLMGDA
jgi:hypothetical protein